MNLIFSRIFIEKENVVVEDAMMLAMDLDVDNSFIQI